MHYSRSSYTNAVHRVGSQARDVVANHRCWNVQNLVTAATSIVHYNILPKDPVEEVLRNGAPFQCDGPWSCGLRTYILRAHTWC